MLAATRSSVTTETGISRRGGLLAAGVRRVTVGARRVAVRAGRVVAGAGLAAAGGGFVAAVLLAGCRLSAGPGDYLDSPRGALRGAHGGWVELQPRGGRPIAGELIAISPDTVWVLNEVWSDGRPGARSRGSLVSWDLEATPVWAVGDLRLVTSHSGASGITLWTSVGTLSTLSHGALLVFSAPLWVIAGAVSSHQERSSAISDLRAGSWDDLRHFARFPQGIPTVVDRGALRPKARKR